MTVDDLLERLDSVRKSGSGKNWRARCPAHDDAHSSLSVGRGEAGRILVYCHAGCQFDKIMRSLNLSDRDILPDAAEGRRSGHQDSAPQSIRATYQYRDEAGTLLFETVRCEPKDFRQRRPDGQGGWIWNLDGVRRVLYRLPELRGQRTIYVTEGEKDADRLATLGFAATTSPMGAGKWREEYVEQLKAAECEQVVVIEDHDEAGHKHGLDVVTSCRHANLTVKHVSLPWPFRRRPKGGEDVSDWLERHTADELNAVIARTPVAPDHAGSDPVHVGPAHGDMWAQAVPVGEFLDMTEPEVSWLEENVVAPGSITELFSPRGLGKTHIAYAIAVKLARRGIRVLLLDRDNSRREVKRRLTAWGAAGLTTFKVMLRDHVPPLTETAAWDTFPSQEWDLVIIDSLDAATEGVGEKDSSKPSKAIAPILDIAHRAGGPAIFVLGNTIKSGEHSRGSGVVEDRADIAYEVRDATDLKRSGTKDWWLELPPAGAGAWAERASRRKRRAGYRLAFVPSKFRIGEEPEPFVYEINLALEPWSLRLVTAEIIQAGQEARAGAERERTDRQDRAAEGLLATLSARAQAGDPMTTADATEYLLTEHQLKRKEARALLDARAGTMWESREDRTLRGKPKLWHPISRANWVVENVSAAEIPPRESTPLTRLPESAISASRMDRARQEYPLAETRINGRDSVSPISAAEPGQTGAPDSEEEVL